MTTTERPPRTAPAVRPARAELTALRGIVVRDLHQMWRYRAAYVSVILTALILPLVYQAQAEGFAGDSEESMASFRDLSGTDDIAGFLYLGWAVLMWVSVILYGPASALRTERERGTLESILLTSVSRRTLLIGSSIAPMVPTLVMFAVVCLFMRASIGVELSWADVARLAVVLVVSTPALVALGMLFSSLTMLTRDANGAVSVGQSVVSVLCGVTYPIAVLPVALQWVSQVLPPTQTIQLLRAGALEGPGLAAAGWRVVYLLVIASVLVVVADATLGRALAHGRRTGRIAQH